MSVSNADRSRARLANSAAPPFIWPTWTGVTLPTALWPAATAGCLLSPFCCAYGLFQKPSSDSGRPGNRLLSMRCVKKPPQVPAGALHNRPCLIKPHSNGSCMMTLTPACMIQFLNSFFCLSEPFTLLHTRNLKRCSMDCSCQIVDWCTCPRPELQVSGVLASSMSKT